VERAGDEAEADFFTRAAALAGWPERGAVRLLGWPSE
jgi:hypothetical protein